MLYTNSIAVAVNTEDYQQVRTICETRKISMSQFFRELLAKELKGVNNTSNAANLDDNFFEKEITL
ncbi:MAG: hypothetical protein V1872_14700 [bacterium]